MKRKLTLIIILLALILAFTAGSVIAKQPQTYLNCESGTACTVDAEGGSTVVVWMLGACEVNESPPFVFIMC